MKRRWLAFTLGGGGAHGALQVGTIRALLEAGIHPDLIRRNALTLVSENKI